MRGLPNQRNGSWPTRECEGNRWAALGDGNSCLQEASQAARDWQFQQAGPSTAGRGLPSRYRDPCNRRIRNSSRHRGGKSAGHTRYAIAERYGNCGSYAGQSTSSRLASVPMRRFLTLLKPLCKPSMVMLRPCAGGGGSRPRNRRM